jgi:hypothetical protein
METNNTQQTPQPAKSGIGSIIGTIIIIAIIILGGRHLLNKRVEEAKLKQDLVTDGTSEQTSLSNSASTDDLNSIDADLQSTTEINALGSELDQ